MLLLSHSLPLFASLNLCCLSICGFENFFRRKTLPIVRIITGIDWELLFGRRFVLVRVEVGVAVDIDRMKRFQII